MPNSSQSRKPHQVFISFRGKGQRESIISFLKLELERSNVNVFIDENEIRGRLHTKLFERIRESSVALVFFSDKYPESSWCLKELAEIVETRSLVAFPIFYKVRVHNIRKQTGCFRNTLIRTEDDVRKNVDRSSYMSILETEAMIWRWRQALVSVCNRTGISYRHSSDEAFVKDIVAKVKETLDDIPSPRNDLISIEKPLMRPQEAVTSLLHAQNLKISDLEDLITKPSIRINDVVSLGTDHLVFLDIISLKNPILAQRLIQQIQAGRILLVLLGSLKDCDEGFSLKPLLLPKEPQQLLGNRVIVSPQEIQDPNYPLPAQITNDTAVIGNRFQTAESNDNLQNRRPGEHNYYYDALTCLSFLCNIMKHCAMMISPRSHRVCISFGKKEVGKNLVSFLKRELESNRMSVYIEDEMKVGIKESEVAIVVFSANYPESEQCLDELSEIKKLMDAGEIDVFPVFYKLQAEKVKGIKGCFRNRLLRIEDEVRKSVDRGNDKSILDTEARIWGLRQALVSIASRPGLSYQHGSDSRFVSDVLTEVKKHLMNRQERKATTIPEAATTEVFYSLTSFLEALNRDITDLEGFAEIPNGLVSLRLKGHTNLVLLQLSSPENLIRFQRSDLFKFLKGFSFESFKCHQIRGAFSGLGIRVQSI